MTELSSSFLDRLRDNFHGSQLLTDPGDRWVFGFDNSRKHAQPDAVVFPKNTEEVQNCVRLCNEARIPIVARGRGTNTTGASIPYNGGIVLSLEQMNQILDIDPDNRLVRTQTGVTNQQIQEALRDSNLFWPPDPTSAEVCTVGGNLATNAAGPRAVKYGATRDNVLGLTAVSGTGEKLVTGVSTTKSSIGYDLTRLLIGSEGTLALITEATLKLSPIAEKRVLMRAIYRSTEDATDAIVRLMQLSVSPSLLEFMDRKALSIVRDRSDLDVPQEAGALLMIEAEGLDSTIEAITGVIQQAASSSGLLAIDIAKSNEEIRALWAMRKALSPALRKLAPNKINEDVVVPVSRLPELIHNLEELSRTYGINIVNFGHAGNGNIHVNLLYDTDDPNQREQAPKCLEKVFQLVLKLGGSLSGEHGIGHEKRNYIGQELGKPVLDMMWNIKSQFDPNGILNPGKLFPAEYWSKRAD